jgi:hypothetical protein
MGNSVGKYFEMRNNKDSKVTINETYYMPMVEPNPEQNPIDIFEDEYPDLSEEFKAIQQEQYELFAKKMLDYGLNNVTLGGDIVNNSDDKKFSLTGLTIRLTDKINRLRNLVVSGKNYVKDEGMEDTFIDIANYGIIGMLVGRNRWKR